MNTSEQAIALSPSQKQLQLFSDLSSCAVHCIYYHQPLGYPARRKHTSTHILQMRKQKQKQQKRRVCIINQNFVAGSDRGSR